MPSGESVIKTGVHNACLRAVNMSITQQNPPNAPVPPRKTHRSFLERISTRFWPDSPLLHASLFPHRRAIVSARRGPGTTCVNDCWNPQRHPLAPVHLQRPILPLSRIPLSVSAILPPEPSGPSPLISPANCSSRSFFFNTTLSFGFGLFCFEISGDIQTFFLLQLLDR